MERKETNSVTRTTFDIPREQKFRQAELIRFYSDKSCSHLPNASTAVGPEGMERSCGDYDQRCNCPRDL